MTLQDQINLIRAMIARCNGSPSLRGHLERELAQLEAKQIQLEGTCHGYGC